MERPQRCLLIAVIVGLVGTRVRAEVVGAAEAASAVGRPVTLQYAVQEIGQSGDGSFLELYSQKAWDAPGCVFIRLPRASVERIAALGITDLQSLWKGRTVEALGTPDWLTFADVPQHHIVCLTLDKLDGLHVLPAQLERKDIHEFTVYVDAAQAATARREVAEVQATVEAKLAEIVQLVSTQILAEFRNVPITIQRCRNTSAAAYDWREREANLIHPGPPRGIMVNNWYEFNRVSREDQPLALLHEFAHAYHHRLLGGDHPGVLAAYRHAMQEQLYERVARRGAKMQRAYAATNEKEYFCELTEAWFGANDYYPFDHRDLARHDPMGARLMLEVWGEPRRRHGD